MAKIHSGQLAKIYIDDELIGLFDSVDYGAEIFLEDAYILGRSSAAEIAETGYSTVSVNLSGFRIIGNGVHVLPKFPKVQDLVGLGSFKLDVVDRNSGEAVATVLGCKWNRYGTGFQARSLSRVQMTCRGLILQDESGDQGEGPGAADLP